ncbi:MAG: hypothetical protein ACLFVN_09515 [Phycisphaeraceae bacterium]
MTTRYPQPDARLDLFGGTSGTYAGFDRFGRLIDQRWQDVSAGTDLVRHGHGYDRAGNRLWLENTVATGRDELYSYDGLHRLDNLTRGTLDDSDADGEYDRTLNDTFAQQWALDALGNWSQWAEDLDHDGSFDQRHYALSDASFRARAVVDAAGRLAERYAYTLALRPLRDGGRADPIR